MKPFRKKKIVVVNVGDNDVAKEVIKALKDDGAKNIIEIKAPESYADYYGIATEDADYTMFLKEDRDCIIRPCSVDNGISKKRNTKPSRDAVNVYRHHLMMIGLNPKFSGTYKIPFESVKYLPWYYTDKKPLIFVYTPNIDGIGNAISLSVNEYFKKCYKADLNKKDEDENKCCKDCGGLYGTVDR